MGDIEAIKAELRTLLAAATPGPWARLTHGTASQRDAAMRAAQAVMAHRLPDSPEIEFTDISWIDQADPEAPHIALTGNGPKSRENAALIVALRNHAEALLADSRSAEPDETHEPGDNHDYRIECTVCGEEGMIRISVDPGRFGERAALAAGTHEPAVDDFGNQYLLPTQASDSPEKP